MVKASDNKSKDEGDRMNATEEVEYYRREYEAERLYQSLDPHGEIPDDIRLWREHWEQIERENK